LFGLAGSVLIWYSTRWGPWVYSDSAGYIGIAKNILEGKGLGLLRPDGVLNPLTLHVPFYPILLSAIGFTGLDIL